MLLVLYIYFSYNGAALFSSFRFEYNENSGDET